MSEQQITSDFPRMATEPASWDRTARLSSGRLVPIERVMTDCRPGPWQRFDWITGERVTGY